MILNLLSNKWIRRVFIAFLVLALTYYNYKLQVDARRLKSNYEVLIGERQDQLNLTRSEFKDYVNNNERIKAVLRDSLKIKNKQVVGLTTAESRTKIFIKVQNRDSIVYVPDTLGIKEVRYHTFKYDDKWNQVTGLCGPDSTSLSIKSYDSLTIVGFWYKERKFFISRWFEKRKLKTEIVSQNPDASYSVSRQIGIK